MFWPYTSDTHELICKYLIIKELNIVFVKDDR